MLKLILSDNTEIEVKDGSTLFDMQVDVEQYVAMWGSLTESNLKLVKLTSDSGNLIDQKENLVVDSQNSFMKNGEVKCHFYLREKNELELANERIALLEETLGIHDGAINDLATVISDLSERGGIS